MLEDYCHRIQQLNKQKNDFIKLKYKTSTIFQIDKQQNKYHKYILSQIAYKNRLDALVKITLLVNQSTAQQKRNVFNILQKNNAFRDSHAQKIICKSNGNDLNQTQSQAYSQKIISSSVKSLKQKLKNTACNFITKWANSYSKAQVRFGFEKINRKMSKIKQIQKIEKLIRRKIQFQRNVFFQLLKNTKTQQVKKTNHQNQENRSFIFSLNEFSQIIPYTIEEEESQELSTSRIKNIQEIDSKFSPLSQSHILASQAIQKNQAEHKLMLQSFEKLKDQVLLMRNLLNEKNKMLKLKDQQIYKIKRDYDNKIQNLCDQISSKIQKEYLLRQASGYKFTKKAASKIDIHNDSYLKQLQTHIIGDRTPRENRNEQDPISQQLLEKYMKECFQMREKMDMAREMCEQFQFDSRTDQGQIMIQIIKLLTPQERLNACME